ncbi:MAG: DUF465 domain-containing protein [Alphaproteobacteria bacterium]|nr:DUF465 domain-containing protein [Alphaproteobacteria bacterium]
MDQTELRQKLVELKTEHRDLDAAVAALLERSPSNHVEVQRLKKRKLALRDRIRQIESLLYPDIIA